MTREDKLRSEAKARNLLKALGKSAKITRTTLDANRPENMYNSDLEITEGWEESGIMEVARNTMGEDSGW
jgi:hypothetical protein